MNFASKIENEPLSIKVQRALIDAMTDRYKRNGSNRLPSESELSDMLGVSRTVLRDVLANLEAHGFISRKRGVGTIINQHILNLKLRMDIDNEIIHFIEETGNEGHVDIIQIEKIPCTDEISGKLNIKTGELVYQIIKSYRIDAEIVACSMDIFPTSLICRHYSEDALKQSIFDFFENYCLMNIETSATYVKAEVVSDDVRELFKKEDAFPCLRFDDVGYNSSQEPVLWSRQYYTSERFPFTVLRRKLF